ncbi:DUF6242 domain-containing protein [uncultured Bacteroides sp.]|uniref:DUF6242 domain-containing protein n=1 Tax=uncultured Bacteroides sp. TaxID=162156 RepID=UPI002AA64A4A|nr:DUF6242 domain-containing protein [uncultured Bacteroides sp.]
MKIKFLSIIISSLFISFAVTSCLNTDDNAEYSSDDTIHAFAIDTIHGADYAFTIDQSNNKIYNADSLPVGSDTIINKILIKTLTVNGYITSGDSAFNIADSVDLTKTMVTPLKLKVWAPDGTHSREYSIEVRVHQQDPDSLVWNKISNSFSNGEVTGKQKSVIINNTLFVYTSNVSAYSSAVSDGHFWDKITVIGLPDDTNISSLLNFGNTLYAATGSGEVFYSENGITWQKNQTGLSGNIVTLITSFPTGITGITKDGTVLKFCLSNPSMTGWEIGEEVPDGFPLENISATVYTTNTKITKSFLMGKAVDDASATQTIPWFSIDGKTWVDASTSSNYYCPIMNNPSIIRYNDKFYAFGGDFSSFYASEDGIVWKEVKKKVLFPNAFKGRGDYSMTVDENNFIWITWSKGQNDDEVWRGRINKLGFLVK